MNIFKGSGDYFALDIGTNAVRVVQLKPKGEQWQLVGFGYGPVDPKVSGADSEDAKRKLADIIMNTVSQSGIRTRDVVINLPSSKTFTTIVDVPMVSEAELKATMKYQIDQYIPMAVEDAKVDWALLGDSLRAQNQQEVLLSSVAKNYSEDRMELVESLGLNVIAAEPDPIAMVRALTPPGLEGAVMQLDMGEQSTDITIVYSGVPRLVRTIPVGLSTFVKTAVTNLNVQEDQARQFIVKFGLATDKLDGQVYKALESTLDGFVSEVSKSAKFFETRYQNTAVASVMVAGFAAAIPYMSNYIATKLGRNVALADPWQGVEVMADQQTALASVASEYTVAVGLAKRGDLL